MISSLYSARNGPVPAQRFVAKPVSRLFYPILISVTAALAATLWIRHGLPIHWLTALGAAVAQAQPPSPADNGGPQRWNGTENATSSRPQRLPPTAPATGAAPPNTGSRARQAPYTQARIETPGGPRGLEVTRPVPVVGAKVVARVGHEIILEADLLPAVNEEFEHEAKNVPKEYHEQLRQRIMYQQVLRAVQTKIVANAMKEDIPTDKLPDMEKQILGAFDKMALPQLYKHWKVNNPVRLDAILKEHGSSLKKQKEAFIEQMLVGEWMRKEVKYDEHVGHEEMLKYYREHIAEYQFKAKARYEEIRVNYGERKRTRQDALRLINDLGRRVFAGASMAELAKTHSEGLHADAGGLHDWTSQGSLSCKPVDEALFTLPVGALSNIIEDEGRGFVIVRVVERRVKGVTSFGDAQSGIRDKIKQQREKIAREKTLSKVLEKHKARVSTMYDDLARKAEKPTENTPR